MDLTQQFKNKVREAVLEARGRFGGTDTAFAKSLQIPGPSFSRLKKGDTEKLLSDSTWIKLGRIHNVSVNSNPWKVARTSVYDEIEDNLHFCKTYSKSMILVDDCGIGKTFCSKHILKTIPNAFYVDCSQAKRRISFIRLLARTIGMDNSGKIQEVKENIKYALNTLNKPLVVLDEAGDLDYGAWLDLKELWNGSTGNVGWYMMGADGLRSKIEKGINRKKVGYREIFSRFSDEFVTLVPYGKADKERFYTQLLGDVAMVNAKSKSNVPKLVNQSMKKESTLRYLETLIQLQA